MIIEISASTKKLAWCVLSASNELVKFCKNEKDARKVAEPEIGDQVVKSSTIEWKKIDEAAPVAAPVEEVPMEEPAKMSPFPSVVLTDEPAPLPWRAIEPADEMPIGMIVDDEATGEFLPGMPIGMIEEEEPVAKKASKKPAGIVGRISDPSLVRPTKLVWAIADELLAKGITSRKEVVDECIARGVAFYTARTQYQAWFTTQKNMRAEEALRAEAQAKFNK